MAIFRNSFPLLKFRKLSHMFNTGSTPNLDYFMASVSFSICSNRFKIDLVQIVPETLLKSFRTSYFFVLSCSHYRIDKGLKNTSQLLKITYNQRLCQNLFTYMSKLFSHWVSSTLRNLNFPKWLTLILKQMIFLILMTIMFDFMKIVVFRT